MPSKRISISFSKSKKVVPHKSLSSSPNFEFAENNPMIRKEILEDILDKFPNKNIKNTKIEKINEESKKIYPLRDQIRINHGAREERDNRTKKFANINKMYEVSNINSKKTYFQF